MNARLHLRMRFPSRTLTHAVRCAKQKLAPSLPRSALTERSRRVPEMLSLSASARKSPAASQTSPTPVLLSVPRGPAPQNITASAAAALAPAPCPSQLELTACLELFAPIGFLPSNGEFASLRILQIPYRWHKFCGNCTLRVTGLEKWRSIVMLCAGSRRRASRTRRWRRVGWRATMRTAARVSK